MSNLELIQRLEFVQAADPEAIEAAIAKIKEYEAAIGYLTRISEIEHKYRDLPEAAERAQQEGEEALESFIKAVLGPVNWES